jgi:magnesium chelatase accessory protein
MVRRLIDSTGSVLDETGSGLYHRLVSNPAHVRDVLTMMAHWDLRPLARDLPGLSTPLALVATAGDRTVPPGESRRVHRLVPGSQLIELPSLGHLAHEEQPGEFAELITRLARNPASAARVAGAA